MNLAPIVLFVYNRPDHTKKTLEALKKNQLAKESELFIYSDESKNEKAQESVKAVRDYIKSIDGFKKVTIVEREKNWGLANSIIDGVTKTVNKYGKAIVLEDDLVTSPYFIRYMNDGLNFYQNDKRIVSITGFTFSKDFMKFPKNYSHDIYLNIRPMSWSFATWKDKWDGVDWEVKDYEYLIEDKDKINAFNQGGTDLIYMLQDQMKGKVNSWYIRWAYDAYKKNLFTIYPITSFVNNYGHDSSGIHCSTDPKSIFSHTELNYNMNTKFVENVEMNDDIIVNFNRAFNIRLKSKIKKFFKNELL